jgi:hypothetical protein
MQFHILKAWRDTLPFSAERVAILTIQIVQNIYKIQPIYSIVPMAASASQGGKESENGKI